MSFDAMSLRKSPKKEIDMIEIESVNYDPNILQKLEFFILKSIERKKKVMKNQHHRAKVYLF